MKYMQDRVERPTNTWPMCLLVEGTIQLASYDADLNIVFPGGQKAILQWRIDGPTLDLCFNDPVVVFNNGHNMIPAPARGDRPEQHYGVMQLVIPLRPEYREEPPNCHGSWEAYHDEEGQHVQAPRDDEQREEAKS